VNEPMNEAISTVHLAKALTPEGWRRDVRLTIEAGAISSIEIGAAARDGEERHDLGVPGIANLHSHAFQRAMAGLAERRSASADNFWSWRETMYRFALAMTPDQVEAVAAQAYVEMLEAGFTRVGEFHYLHHAPDGRAYDDVGEMSARIAAATEATRIGLTLLPVFYAHSGFGGAAPNDAQRRFICDLDLYARLVERGLSTALMSAWPPIRCAQQRIANSKRSSRSRGGGRSTSTSRNRSRRSKPASRGRARARSNGCSIMPMSGRAGA
jgi:formimidoylglutamate deiminase